MGLLDAIFNIDLPHRKVGRLAKDYCITLSISDRERHILDKFHLDKDKFIRERNALLVRLFNLWFLVAEKETANNPNATVHLAKVFFQDLIWEYRDSLQEPDKLKMKEVWSSVWQYQTPEESSERFYLAVSGTQIDLVGSDMQLEFKAFVDDYNRDVATFIKKHSPKLLK